MVKERKRKLDRKETGITYNNSTWMVDGYIEDFISRGQPFEENTGYVDEDHNIYIFYSNPGRSKNIPWFSWDKKGKKLIYNENVPHYYIEAFKEDNIRDLAIDVIVHDADTDTSPLYDDDMKNDINNASKKYVPTMREQDDFLKKLIKKVILEKDVDANRYKGTMPHSHEINNLKQILEGATRTSPAKFNTWMDLLCCDFKVIVSDDGRDVRFPLPKNIIYESITNRIYIEGEEEEDGKYAKSVKQFGSGSGETD